MTYFLKQICFVAVISFCSGFLHLSASTTAVNRIAVVPFNFANGQLIQYQAFMDSMNQHLKKSNFEVVYIHSIKPKDLQGSIDDLLTKYNLDLLISFGLNIAVIKRSDGTFKATAKSDYKGTFAVESEKKITDIKMHNWAGIDPDSAVNGAVNSLGESIATTISEKLMVRNGRNQNNSYPDKK